VHVTDAVDISLVKPRTRKYDTAGAASAVAGGGAAAGASASKSAAPAAAQPSEKA
jgi:succinate dehydrogenase / fumarate reductase flavoprotein subunit